MGHSEWVSPSRVTRIETIYGVAYYTRKVVLQHLSVSLTELF